MNPLLQALLAKKRIDEARWNELQTQKKATELEERRNVDLQSLSDQELSAWIDLAYEVFERKKGT